MILSAHELEHDTAADHAASAEARLEAARGQLSDDLFDGYMTNNYSVIDEVDQMLSSVDTLDNLLKKLRDSFTMDGKALRTAYMKVVAACCDEIANRYTDIDEAYRDFDL